MHTCEALLRAEGFTDVRYIDTTPATTDEDLGSGKLDFASHLSLDHAIAIDHGLPITILTGLHAGCYELFAHEGIRSIADLKGKRIGAESILLSLMDAYVGLDPKKDLNLVENRATEPLELFAADTLGLTDTGADARTGKNGRHRLAGLLRQSVFGRLAGYEDVPLSRETAEEPKVRRLAAGGRWIRTSSSALQQAL